MDKKQPARKNIPVEEVAKEWMKDPEFRAAYDALENEFVAFSSSLPPATAQENES